MLSLHNASLSVAVLEPVTDNERFGARYCTGGYIYQITDARLGDLLSGPTFPHNFNWFDGQGIPDAFREHLVDPTDAANPHELGIGIGLIRRSDNSIAEFCKWDVQESPHELTFRTTQSFLSWSFELTRVLSLRHRTLQSTTQLRCTGERAVPVNWFPHPFFPHYESGETIKCNANVVMPENTGYTMLPNGFIGQCNLPWDRRGHFLELQVESQCPLVVLQKHPKVGLLAASFSYAPGYFPIWGNRCTFSFEPYYKTLVNAQDEVTWSVTYDF